MKILAIKTTAAHTLISNWRNIQAVMEVNATDKRTHSAISEHVHVIVQSTIAFSPSEQFRLGSCVLYSELCLGDKNQCTAN